MLRVTGRASAAVLAFVCVLGWVTATARAEVRVHIDCHLQSGPVECRALEGAFYESMGPSVGRGGRGADVALRVRAVALATSVHYEIGSSAGDQSLSLSESIPGALDRDATLLRVLSLLERGTLPFLPLASAHAGDDGELRLQTRDAPRTAPDDDEQQPFYLRPSLSGELVSQGASMISLGGRIEASWSDARWRVLASGRTAFRHLRIDIPGAQRIEGSTWSASAPLVIARSITGGLSVAALAEIARAPQNNLDRAVSAGGGVEWIRVPIRRDEESNYGARYRLLAVSHDYVTPNLWAESERLFARHSLTAFVSWHTGALDLALDASGSMVLDRPQAWDVGSEASLTWRATDSFEVTIHCWATYRGRAVNEPADPNGLDPIAVVVSGSDFGTMSFGGQLELSYTFGNGLMHARDQRWK